MKSILQVQFQKLYCKNTRFHNADTHTLLAMQKLRAHGLTTDSVLDMTEKTLGELIYPVGFWKRKVQYLKKTAQILKDTYEDDIPDNVDDLCKVRVTLDTGSRDYEFHFFPMFEFTSMILLCPYFFLSLSVLVTWSRTKNGTFVHEHCLEETKWHRSRYSCASNFKSSRIL